MFKIPRFQLKVPRFLLETPYYSMEDMNMGRIDEIQIPSSVSADPCLFRLGGGCGRHMWASTIIGMLLCPFNVQLEKQSTSSGVLGVLSLKTQLSKVICRNSMDISSSTTNILQGNPPISYGRSLSCSPDNNGDIMAPNHEPEYEFEVPESAVSSYGDVADVDMLECTVGLLSVDAPLHQWYGRDLCKDLAEDVLINNQAVEEELKNIEQVSHGGVRLQKVAKEEAQSCSEDAKPTPIALLSAPGAGGENGQALVLKPCYTGKKRGRKPKKKRGGGCVSGLKSESV